MLEPGGGCSGSHISVQWRVNSVRDLLQDARRDRDVKNARERTPGHFKLFRNISSCERIHCRVYLRNTCYERHIHPDRQL